MAVHCNTLSRLRQENREFWTVGPSLKTSKPQKRKRGIKARRKEVEEKEGGGRKKTEKEGKEMQI